MSETTFRGPPKEDGTYEVLCTNGDEEVREFRNGRWFTTRGFQCRMDFGESVQAHRRHEPLVVPELQELHRCEGKPCVVRMNRNHHIYYAVKFPSGNYDVHDQMGGTDYPTNYSKHAVTELTKEQCEAEGWKWPL